MKSILLSGTAALLLVAASGAYAQPDQNQNDKQHGQQDNHAGQPDNHPGGDQHMSGPGDQPNTMSGAHGTMSGPTHDNTTTHTTTHRTRHRTTTHATTTTTTNGDHHNNNNNNNNNNGHDNNGGDHNNGHPHGQFSASLRITLNATHHFRGPAWHPPRGYVYRRYTVGARLAPEFYARDYWLSDYSDYDLIAAPDGYVWVRFGPDALLIDEDTGEVVRVVYGVFI
jgi:Ni/Co efflux regulator RcnB